MRPPATFVHLWFGFYVGSLYLLHPLRRGYFSDHQCREQAKGQAGVFVSLGASLAPEASGLRAPLFSVSDQANTKVIGSMAICDIP